MSGKDKISASIESRALRLKSPKEIADIVGDSFILAGGALSSDAEPKDFDIFCLSKINIQQILDRLWGCPGWEPILATRNAVTALHHGQTVQFCSFCKSTVEDLIWGFDFTHCQAAAVFARDGSIIKTAYTPMFKAFTSSGETKYTRSEYPLSSLMRCAKFISRGVIAKPGQWKPILLDILMDIVDRGFKDVDDFRDQCASVSESFESMDHVADGLFILLYKGNGK